MTKIIQNPQESFSDFVARMTEAAGRIFGDSEQAMPFPRGHVLALHLQLQKQEMPDIIFSFPPLKEKNQNKISPHKVEVY